MPVTVNSSPGNQLSRVAKAYGLATSQAYLVATPDPSKTDVKTAHISLFGLSRIPFFNSPNRHNYLGVTIPFGRLLVLPISPRRQPPQLNHG